MTAVSLATLKELSHIFTTAIANLRDRVEALEGGGGREARSMALPFTITKFASSGRRTIHGLASTPSVDRHGDIVVPTGGSWRLPLPLLFAHDHRQVIGVVKSLSASAQGLHVEAELAEGIGRADEVWKLIQARALDSFSIGFAGIKSERIETGRRWVEWELLEISVVAVPSNRDSKLNARALPAGAVKLTASAPHRHTGSIKLRRS